MKPLMLGAFLFAIVFLTSHHGVIAYAAVVNIEVRAGAGYESNVFRSATDPKKDTYFRLAPGLALKLPFSKAYFSSSSRFALEQYVSQTGADLQELTFSGLGRYNTSNYVSFGLRDRLIISEHLRVAEKLSDMPRQRDFMDNRLVFDLKYGLEPGVLETFLECANIARDYKDTERDDWVAHTGRIQVKYFLGHKTSTQVEFGLVRKVYKVDVDYVSVPVILSLERKLSSKLNASFSLGSEGRRYNEAQQDRNWDKPIVSLDITGKFTPKTSSRLLLQRKVYDSDIATGYAFVSTAVDFSLALDLSDLIHMVLEGLFSRNSYIEIERSDSFFAGHGSMEYSFSRWGKLVLSYSHERGLSSVSAYGYQQHTIDLSYVVVI